MPRPVLARSKILARAKADTLGPENCGEVECWCPVYVTADFLKQGKETSPGFSREAVGGSPFALGSLGLALQVPGLDRKHL